MTNAKFDAPPPETLIFLRQISKNARLNKHQHFNAAERNKFYNNIFGSAAILINVILGSVLFITASNTLPEITKWVSGFMAMIAAVCGGIQTFFNFEKLFEGHRRIANNYLEVQRESEQVLAAFADNLIDLPGLVKQVEIINEKYNTVNSNAEGFPTNDKDYRKAKQY
ncbi:SLATT domain-containing protein [Nostoc sp. WHI]|uniref:SLATT domain-containing protein n=1 Tax=Nostoc sp. WHI TaxID=2650611 RepID=UPI0018C7DB16|nr:SLATT domain-containing protein [Nostoc sp. WHI]MBG1269992.1 SLATT domain-containing protein [Nostoc sp. WHI]